jgi:5'-nucleotidase
MFIVAIVAHGLDSPCRHARAYAGRRCFQYSGARIFFRELPALQVKILLSNDDGYRAEGIRRLAEALKDLGSVTIVAPERNRSGAGHSLTIDSPLRVFQVADDTYYVTGTPTDCVHLAISGLFEHEHDIVISGVNDGANLGDDVLYSGTVAGAIEGRFLGLPTLAVSLCTSTGSGRHFDTGARIARELVMHLLKSPLHASMILNVNVPDRPYAELQGMRATRLGNRHRSERVVRSQDPRGAPIFWVGPAGAGQDAGPGTDFSAVAEGYVSVTPLQIDLTRHAAVDSISEWLKSLHG